MKCATDEEHYLCECSLNRRYTSQDRIHHRQGEPFTAIRMQTNNVNKSLAAGMTVSLDCRQGISKIATLPELQEPESALVRINGSCGIPEDLHKLMVRMLLVESFTDTKIRLARLSNIPNHRYKNKNIHAKELEMFSKSQKAEPLFRYCHIHLPKNRSTAHQLQD